MNYLEKNYKEEIHYYQGDFKLNIKSEKEMKNRKSEKNLVKNHLKQKYNSYKYALFDSKVLLWILT